MNLQRIAVPGGNVEAAVQIPYRTHVAPTVVRTSSGDYLSAWRVRGLAFECQDPEVLNAAHERLNIWVRSVAAPNVAIWTHVVRRRDRAALSGSTPPGFAGQVVSRYRAHLSQETLWANELYLTILYRARTSPAATAATALIQDTDAAHSIAIDELSKLRRQFEASLAGYAPEILGEYQREGRSCSSLLEFFGVLVNAEHQNMPLPAAPLNEILATTRLLIGWETIEYRQPTTTRYGAFLGIKEYPPFTRPGALDSLLTAPFPFVLTQSFACIGKAAAMALMSGQAHRLRNAGDAATTQLKALGSALDQLASNEFTMGQHHLSLQILTEPVTAANHTPARELQKLGDSLAAARSILADAGVLAAREDIALEPAFWAQLPGNFQPRPRVAPITSRNYVALSAMHNFPAGRQTGNHWGESLALLKTSAATAYHFSLHASDPDDPDGGSRRDTGHTFICGPTGSGKTVFLGFCICLLLRQSVTQVVFDKDHGLEVLIRALGGEYLELRRGMPTGCNPLQLPDGPASRAFLRTWLFDLLQCSGGLLSVREQAELDLALDGVMGLDAAARRLSRLLEFLDPTTPEGTHARLSQWCEVTGGTHAWAFDSGDDSVLRKVSTHTLVGFDMTELIDDKTIRAPLTAYLFHVVEMLLDGRRLVAWLDEFSKLVCDPGFADLASNGTKTWRKRNGVIAFVTQSPADISSSPAARALIEQTPTKVLFPNVDARREDYQGALGLSQREFILLKTGLAAGSRRFLIKQGRESVIADLDLKGFDAELKVISGRTSTIRELHMLMDEVGPDPESWLPRFTERPKS